MQTRQANVTIVGGGSYNWSPKLLTDLARTPSLSGQLTLVDIDPDTLEVMVPLGRRAMRELGGKYEVTGTTRLAEGLDGADYVILTINTGGREARRQDIGIPEKYGVVQTVGDTVGPGGLIRGIRNIPIVVGIAREMERRCPSAWLMNYSNPMCILTRAATAVTDIRVVGMCHELAGLEHKLMDIFEVEEEGRIEMKVAGINHLSWVLEARLDGRDLFRELREHIRNYERPDVAYEYFSPYLDLRLIKYALFEITGALGVAGDRHIAEFYPHFISKESDYGWKYGVKRTTPDDYEQRYLAAGELAKAMASGDEPLYSEKSGEVVFGIIESIEHDLNRQFFVNLPNRGQISNLPLEHIVETYAVADSQGLTPIAVGSLPKGIAATCRLHGEIQELIVQATLENDSHLALQAFLMDPLIRDFGLGRKMFAEMCQAHGLFR